ncbi:ABC transporter substrate-binding protein [Nocardia transvalensis]|uniref:ABC transporter substrate-binding protein n=1 Tax=Nocardia transvalensis TaxID=37333 RepID=UPI0018937BC0|nr:ABC transporter substrate-binding protein [Nocardia transvalensis]MBF6331906.1 ABC transporter substrate-binding protein [Nocardia transvalensis]
MTGPEAQPHRGGTLRLYGPGDIDRLDPTCSPRTPTDQILRLLSRQLFTYRPVADLHSWQAIAPIPDLAREIPSIYNAGVGASYTSYVVHLRSGVLWDTTPARPVTAYDVARGFKRMCNPLRGPAVLPYFTSTIRGMAEYCEGYAAAVHGAGPNPVALAAYQNSHEISGVRVLDDETVVFELIRPALDFIDLLTLPCTSPAPAEYDAFLPDDPELPDNIRSTGPYRLARRLVGKQLQLRQNPFWHKDVDPVRNQYPETVEVTTEPVSADRVVHRIATGEADFPWGTLPGNSSATGVHEYGLALDPYLVFNTRGTLRDVRVRRALMYAVDKAAIAAIVGELDPGATIRIAGSIIPPGNDGHQDFDPYPTPFGRGDPEHCRKLLAEAGYPDGLTLTAIYPETETSRALGLSYTADLRRAGLTVRSIGLGQTDYRDLLHDPTRTDTGEWDIAIASWWPHWYHNNGRAFLQPMFQTSASGSTANYGRYSDPETDRLIIQALDSPEEPAQAIKSWQEAERRILDNAAILPILFRSTAPPDLHSVRVRSAIPMPSLRFAPDLANVWLASPG